MTEGQPYIAFPLLHSDLLRIIDASLAEDLGGGDVTTDYLIHPAWHAAGSFVVKGEGVLAGIPVAQAVFQRVDPSINLRVLHSDGSSVKPGVVIGEVEGPAPSILRAERVALNFMQR